MLTAISYGGQFPFDRARKPRTLQTGRLPAEGSLGSMYNRLILAHSTCGLDHQNYFEILTVLISERLPGC